MQNESHYLPSRQEHLQFKNNSDTFNFSSSCDTNMSLMLAIVSL